MNNADTILVIEDEYSIRKFININLSRNGFKVIDTEFGKEAIDLFKEFNPSTIVLDIMLPDIDGYEVCKSIRDLSKDVIIIMLTAKSQDMNKIMGLELGADDYMLKPFNPLELVARIRANLRKLPQEKEIDNQIFKIDNLKHKIYKQDKALLLSPKEYAMLNLLIENKHRSLNRNEILDFVWGQDYVGDYKTVDVHIRRLREKIEDDPSNPIFIETIWGYGYRWRGEE